MPEVVRYGLVGTGMMGVEHINNLAVTPGAVVTTADTLMTIVPDGTGIEIEAQVENKDIGFVREGQPVEIKYDAFPFTRYGLANGTVRRLGRDAVQSQINGQSTASAASQRPWFTPSRATTWDWERETWPWSLLAHRRKA